MFLTNIESSIQFVIPARNHIHCLKAYVVFLKRIGKESSILIVKEYLHLGIQQTKQQIK